MISLITHLIVNHSYPSTHTPSKKPRHETAAVAALPAITSSPPTKTDMIKYQYQPHPSHRQAPHLAPAPPPSPSSPPTPPASPSLRPALPTPPQKGPSPHDRVRLT
ncbi:hypothetical protein VC83_01111 [Pseudogymnoascus destructans]|uniref:Uncharacterized protein n=1 Tax=Pseudogymnoascus destructans TaxID=655981 RepID=A0A177AJU7_9PEZI|nr:uncharacterized protein VC83_01111 [Pseudogymnoascus destructans]OAF62336.1 hypothetical protein VC83_01111 [Pseudogymnoascus destructans]